MQKKISNKFTALFFSLFLLLAASCHKPADPYILSLIPQIRSLEMRDHQFCVSLKLNVDREENLNSSYYWRCRLSFARYRLSEGNPTPQQARRDLEINDLITKISLKVNETSETFLSRENKKIDNRQHNKCLAMGFTLYTEDQAKIDDYFSCRKALVEDLRLLPPFKNPEYLNYPNSDYDLGYVIDRRLEEETKKYLQEKAKYPTCVKYGLYSENFRRCTAAWDNARQCLSEIERKIFLKEWEEKTTCQKQAYTRFSDDMIKQDDLITKQEEIHRTNKKSDFYNQYDFASIGIDGTLFLAEAQQEKEEEEKKKAKKDKAKKINSKKELYTKYELTKLRQTYAVSCQKKSSNEIEKFKQNLKSSCEELTKFEALGEE